MIFNGFRQGKRAEEIAKDIFGAGKNELGKVSRLKAAQNRANLIARDQINKLNGQVNAIRQQNVGITHYIWRTADDDRVRPTHNARDDKKFAWDKPPSDGHPGEPINCRCYAEPVFDNLLD